MILYMHMMCFEQDQPQIPPFQTLLSSLFNLITLFVYFLLMIYRNKLITR